MPELAEEMYCSQQITIPPTFPYLLRQFAKAAIRTQPNDLLKWSTTYFRCLSLNVPPPVKPRLEYPIPRDHCGMTPGWLRALLHQIQGAPTVSFRVLWDRWIGACLQHDNLIQILVLGGFEDNTAVPWLRFVALCAAHLTDNLTQTMILVCEVLTEEPEGGSAMIPLQIFLDLYQFLAKIDASVPQTLKNYYFLDKFLELYQEKIERDQAQKATAEVEDGGSRTPSSVTSFKTEGELKKDDGGSVVSCPSVASQDPDNFMKMLMKIHEDEMEEEAMEAAKEKEEVQKPEEDEEVVEEEEDEQEKKDEEKGEGAEGEGEKKFTTEDETTTEQDDSESIDTRISSEKEEFKKHLGKKSDDEQLILMEDLERLKLVQQELMGESDEEVEKFKQHLLAEMQPSESEITAPDHFAAAVPVVSSETVAETIKADETPSTISEPVASSVDEREYEEVLVEAIPGIGAKVPDHMVVAVCNYMKQVANQQHNMVMPRNIRHFECPPLEIVRD